MVQFWVGKQVFGVRIDGWRRLPTSLLFLNLWARSDGSLRPLASWPLNLRFHPSLVTWPF